MRWCLLLVVPLLFCAQSLHAQKLPKDLARQAKEHAVKLDELALYVHVIGERRPRLALNADQPMNPASAMKLVTTAAALNLLGPAYTWRTEAYADGTMENGTLQGNLILKGAGDPKLTVEEFWLLLRQLRARGMQHIVGDLWLDRSQFSPIEGSPGDFDGDGLRPYNALPDALLVNFNAIRLDFIPSLSTHAVQVLMHPPLPQIQIVNHMQVVEGACDEWPQDPSHDSAVPSLTFSGNFPRACGETTRNYSPLRASAYVEAVFRLLWNELGGTFSGQVQERVTPASARLIVTQESEPLSEVIRDINKYSNNVMARQLFLALGSREESPPLDSVKAMKAIAQWLTQQDLRWPELVMENGSGLSRLERISARHLGELLISTGTSPLAPEFIASLPLSGTDGTLRKRFNDTPVAGRAHIKTGYLDGARTSAGYVQTLDGKSVVIVCLVNGSSANGSKPFHDAVIEWAFGLNKKDCCRP